jgi:prepilin-type N-terminal cleavage/methylation domain-containing protein
MKDRRTRDLHFICGNGGIANSGGFTLVEIVITIVLLTILSAIAAVIILQGVRGYVSEDARSDVHYQARLAVERMAREIRSIPSCTALSVPANPSSSIAFSDIISNATVTFNVSGGSLFRNSDLLARGITSAQPFSFFAADGTTLTNTCPGIWFVQIAVTDTQGSESLQIRTRVHPRNF